MAKKFEYLFEDAHVSACGLYRYTLTRVWKKTEGIGCVTWVMLNPSTADAAAGDATIRRIVRFSRDWGYGQLRVVNLFPYRSTDPFVLRRKPDPVGPLNDDAIRNAARQALVVAAWGTHGYYQARDLDVTRMLVGMGVTLHCLSVTKGGCPGHPLYAPAGLTPVVYRQGRVQA